MSKDTAKRQKKQHGEPAALTTPDFLAEQKEQLRQLFPQVFTEGKVDADKLRAAVGDAADERPERYSFTWAGKRAAIQELQKPAWGTLVPAKAESVNFDTTQNLFIEGENLEVLKLLYKSYFGRVKLIYIDPPYNTGNDFVYSDRFADPKDAYLRMTGQKTAEGNLLTSNPETSGRYHSAWLSMMYPRLYLARQFLRDDGAIFVSIDDHEVYNLRLLMNEIFGEENFLATIIWQKVFGPKNTARHFSEDHDYVLVYARNANAWGPELLARSEQALARYENPDKDPRGEWSSSDLTARNYYSEGQYSVTSKSGKVFKPAVGNYWRVKSSKFQDLDRDGRIWWGENGDSMPRLKRFLKEVKAGVVPQTLWKFADVGHTQEAKKELIETVAFKNTNNVIDSVKPTRLIKAMLKIGTTSDENDLVLDFFGGTGVTGHSVVALNQEDGGNRRFIAVQLPEPLPEPEPQLATIADAAKKRIRCAIAQASQKKEGELPLHKEKAKQDLGLAVFKLAPSHLKPWVNEPSLTPEKLASAMELFNDPLADGWKPENVIYEVAAKEGFALASRIERVPAVKANKVFAVRDTENGQSFRICLDDEIKVGTVKELNLKKDDLFICRDVAIDDKLAANLALQCRLKTI